MTFDCGLSLKTRAVEENYLSKSIAWLMVIEWDKNYLHWGYMKRNTSILKDRYLICFNFIY